MPIHVRRRKKDHGRAESLLIAAWAAGCSLQVSDNGISRIQHGPMRSIETSDGYGNPLLYGESQVGGIAVDDVCMCVAKTPRLT